MTELQLTFLGAPQICAGSDDLTHKITGKAFALLVYLAVTGRPHSRDLLADLLWSELSNQQARNNLRYTLSDLRQLIGGHLLVTAQTIAFDRQKPYGLDVEILQAGLVAGSLVRKPEELAAALQRYRGEFLAGFAAQNAPVFADWVQQQRAELHNIVVQGWQQLAEIYWQRQEYRAGLAAVTELLRREPLHEAGYQLQMRLQAASGARVAALSSYQQFLQQLAEQMGVEPTRETTQLYEEIRAGEWGMASALPAVSLALPIPVASPSEIGVPTDGAPISAPALTLLHNLPSQLTPFIGRSEEIADILAILLDPQQRLLTLVGEGGIGKTRLALAVAQALVQAGDAETPRKGAAGNSATPPFVDGVWFVPLAALTPSPDLADQLAGAIASTLQISFTGQTRLREQLFRYLGPKQCLLILDSFEHLLDGADFILELLRHANRCKVLVTSRHILNFQAEYTWRVESLSVPPAAANETLDPELLLRYESVALFVERTRRVLQGFAITQQNQQEIAQICQFVQGLPLGTELAAALTRHYSCAEIAQALERNYAILETAQRDIPPRHRSIQATLAYSWSFLNETEVRVAAQCSLFRGGFGLEAAEQVMGATRPLLNALEEHSLLRLVRDGAGHNRYEMHELVRQYAASQLASVPTLVQTTRERYCAYYTTFIRDREEALVQERQAVLEVQVELNNLRQMWQWATDDLEIHALANSSDGLFRFYYNSGMFQEAELAARGVVGALRALIATTDPTTRADWQQIHYILARTLLTQARQCERLARLAEAEQLTQEGLAAAEQLGAVELQTRGYLGLAALAQIRLDHLTMRTLGEKMVQLVQAGGFTPIEGARMQSYGLKYLGIASLYAGDCPQAMVYFEQGIHLAQQIQDRELETMMINNLGVVHSIQGDFTSALQAYEQTLQLSQSLGEHNATGLALINLGEAYLALGDWAQAREYMGQALTLHHDTGYTLYEAKAWVRLGRIAQAAGNPELAYSYVEQAIDLARSAGLQMAQTEFLTDLGHVLTCLRRFTEAITAYQQALAGWQQLAAPQPIWRVQAGLAEIALLQGLPTTALAYVEEILAALPHAAIHANHDPIYVYWICYRVLTANRDIRAPALLQAGHTLLQNYAAKIADAHLRSSFLQNIPVNRELIVLVQETYVTTAPPRPLQSTHSEAHYNGNK